MKKRAKKRFLSKYDGHKLGWFLLARFFVLALILSAALFGLLVGVSRVDGSSMEPTLSQGDPVFFTRVNFGYHRGDVVFARMPTGSNYVKRVVAVAGDTVDIRDGVLYVNGQPEEPSHHQGRTLPLEGIVDYPLTVPQGSVFLVGDNREGSVDSRNFGPLPLSSIRGKLLLVA